MVANLYKQNLHGTECNCTHLFSIHVGGLIVEDELQIMLSQSITLHTASDTGLYLYLWPC